MILHIILTVGLDLHIFTKISILTIMRSISRNTSLLINQEKVIITAQKRTKLIIYIYIYTSVKPDNLVNFHFIYFSRRNISRIGGKNKFEKTHRISFDSNVYSKYHLCTCGMVVIFGT